MNNTKLWLFISKVEGFRRKDRNKKAIINEELNHFLLDCGYSLKNKEVSYSYCDDYVVCAISEKTRVGIDMENQEKVNQDGISIFFRRDDENLLKKNSATLIWTIHEAIGKLEGSGLASPITLLSIRTLGIQDDQIEVLNRNEKYNFEKYEIVYEFNQKKKCICAYSCVFLKYLILIVKKQNKEKEKEKMETKERIVKMLEERLNLEFEDPTNVDGQLNLFDNGIEEGYGLDSVDALEIVVGLKNEFNISLRDEDNFQDIMKNIDSLVDYVDSAAVA